MRLVEIIIVRADHVTEQFRGTVADDIVISSIRDELLKRDDVRQVTVAASFLDDDATSVPVLYYNIA